MTADTLLLLTAFALCVAITCPVPLRFVVRAGLRAAHGPEFAKRWHGAVAVGAKVGIAAAVLIGAIGGADTALTVALTCALLALALLDFSWRWLPLIWTLPLTASALIQAGTAGPITESLIGAAGAAGLLFALQQTFRYFRKIDALGTGDIWLAAGIGALFGLPMSLGILGLAALSALIAEFAFRATGASSNSPRYGVAFGAHISLVSGICLYL